MEDNVLVSNLNPKMLFRRLLFLLTGQRACLAYWSEAGCNSVQVDYAWNYRGESVSPSDLQTFSYQ